MGEAHSIRNGSPVYGDVYAYSLNIVTLYSAAVSTLSIVITVLCNTMPLSPSDSDEASHCIGVFLER